MISKERIAEIREWENKDPLVRDLLAAYDEQVEEIAELKDDTGYNAMFECAKAWEAKYHAARLDTLEEVAKWHDAEAARADENLEAVDRYTEQSTWYGFRNLRDGHRSYAAAIRTFFSVNPRPAPMAEGER